MESKGRLTPKQVITRAISIIVCGVGAAACGYSLTMQVAEVGNITASVTWFSGLFAVVFALAGYAVTCEPDKRSYIPFAVVCILALAVCGAVFERLYLYTDMVIMIALIAAAVQCVVLVIYHFLLKREDPDAI